MTAGTRPYLLDTSALFALIQDEPGADRVEEVVRRAKAIVPWPVLLELHYVTQQKRGEGEAYRRTAFAKEMGAEIVWGMDEAIALTAAKLKAGHRLSLGDTLIAAFAVRMDAVLMHKDPEYEVLTGSVALEPLPFKSPRPYE